MLFRGNQEYFLFWATEEMIENIEKTTRGQWSNQKYITEKTNRLTDSREGKIPLATIW